MIEDALQYLVNAKIEDKETTENLRIINLMLLHSLYQSQEAILVLSKQLHTQQSQINTHKLATAKNNRDKKSNN